MENKILMCNFCMFDAEQKIFVVNSENGESELLGQCATEELGKVLTELCFANNINKIHLYGNNNYIETITTDIDEHSGCSAYSFGMIEVEVN